MAEHPRPPKEFNKDNVKYWNSLCRLFTDSKGETIKIEPHQRKMIYDLCKCREMISSATDTLGSLESIYLENSAGTTVEHPAVKTIKDFVNLHARICRELQLDIDPKDDSRVPRQYT